MNIKKLFAFLICFSVLFSFGSLFVTAQEGGDVIGGGGGDDIRGPGGGDNTNPSTVVPIKLINPFRGGDTLFKLLETVINQILLPIGGMIVVMAFIYSGFLYVMAQGNEAKLKTAHAALLYTAIGAALLLGSWVFANVIKNTVEQLM